MKQLLKKRRMRREASTAANLQAAASDEVLLEWRELTCTLKDKKTG